MKQLYEVGEQVVAVFVNYPECNGEYVVLEVMTPEQTKAEFPMFSIRENSLYYRLDGLEIEGPMTGTICNAAAERALRKKHEPSQQSFKDLMTTLKSPQKVEWD